jgi:hypothetical protein
MGGAVGFIVEEECASVVNFTHAAVSEARRRHNLVVLRKRNEGCACKNLGGEWRQAEAWRYELALTSNFPRKPSALIGYWEGDDAERMS